MADNTAGDLSVCLDLRYLKNHHTRYNVRSVTYGFSPSDTGPTRPLLGNVRHNVR
jgi:hypothetical protein